MKVKPTKKRIVKVHKKKKHSVTPEELATTVAGVIEEGENVLRILKREYGITTGEEVSPDTDMMSVSEVEEVCDSVNHPSHYNSCSIECIDAMEETQGEEATMHYCILAAFKYLWRWRKKNGEEDLRKAAWYMDRVKKYLK